MVHDANDGMDSASRPNGDLILYPAVVDAEDGTDDENSAGETDAWPGSLPMFCLPDVIEEAKKVYAAVRSLLVSHVMCVWIDLSQVFGDCCFACC